MFALRLIVTSRVRRIRRTRDVTIKRSANMQTVIGKVSVLHHLPPHEFRSVQTAAVVYLALRWERGGNKLLLFFFGDRTRRKKLPEHARTKIFRLSYISKWRCIRIAKEADDDRRLARVQVTRPLAKIKLAACFDAVMAVSAINRVQIRFKNFRFWNMIRELNRKPCFTALAPPSGARTFFRALPLQFFFKKKNARELLVNARGTFVVPPRF